MRNYLFIFFVAAGLLSGCRNTPDNMIQDENPADISVINGIVVADTIIYDVIIRNPDSSDEWTAECLKNLNHRMLIDSLFSMAYSEQAEVYDFFSGVALTPEALLALESTPDFDRSRVGKIQFTEQWMVSSEDLTLSKKVLSLVVGYELYDESGGVRGYKPVFKIDLN